MVPASVIQFRQDPLLENPTRIERPQRSVQRQFGKNVTHAEVEEQKAGRFCNPLSAACLPGNAD